MALYFLNYDLRGQRDYPQLHNELEKFKAVHIFESPWCFNRFNITAAGLRDHFKKFVDGDDGLSVSEISDWATFNALCTPNDLK